MKKKGRSLCVYSPKGGTGKTILALNLAGVASLKEKKVLLIDLDLFNGGLSLLVNEDIKNKNLYKLSDDVSKNNFKNMSEYIVKYNKHIDFLCAPKDPRDAVKINVKFISSLIDKMEYTYDLVIIDTSSYLDKININTLNESDNILLVVTNDLMSIKNTKNMVTIFKETNVDYFKVILNESVDNIDKYFNAKEIKKIIGANVDYLLDDTFYIKDLTSYIFNRKIPVLDKNIFDNYKKEIKKLNNILNDVFSKGDKNE